MSRGGYRSGAGRPKGSKNLRTRAREKAAKRAGTAGTSPLDFLLGMMRDEEQPLKVRMAAAKAAAPYCHPRLSAEHVTTDGPMTHEQWLAILLHEENEQELQPA